MVVALVGTLFAGSAVAAPYDDHKDDKKKVGDEIKQSVEQDAEAEVEQDQDVKQTNVNVQDDNTAVSAALGWKGGEAKSGDALAVQYSDQTNNNAQVGIANAENEAENEYED